MSMTIHETDLTYILNGASAGDNDSIARLWQEVHEDVKDMAINICRKEYSGVTLQPTLLVNEVYLRLYGKTEPLTWENRAHFFGSVARAMGQILIDFARKRKAVRRGGTIKKIPMELVPGELSSPEKQINDEIENLIESLEKLQLVHSRAATVVRFRYMLGLSQSLIADILNITDKTARSDWIWARAWLRREMEQSRHDV